MLSRTSPGSHWPAFLPVYLGDAHAAMGHGELSAFGLDATDSVDGIGLRMEP